MALRNSFMHQMEVEWGNKADEHHARISGGQLGAIVVMVELHIILANDVGTPTDMPRMLADADQSIANSIQQLQAGLEHVGLQRARVGAFYNAADIQSEALARKELLIAETRSGIEDADMAEVISKLQALLVNRDAAQQVFAKLSQQSLFDYLR